MQEKALKRNSNKIFKALKIQKSNIAYERRRNIIMKKILSILLTVTMVFTFVASFRTPTASAATMAISSTDAAKKSNTVTNPKNYYIGAPGAKTPFVDGTYVYKMGDIVHGSVTFATITAGQPYVVELLAANLGVYNVVIDSVTAYEVAGVLTYPFQISTGNVSYDGPYQLRVRETLGDTESVSLPGPIFIQYNITWINKTIESCFGSNTISGYITRGQGQTVLVPVIVGVTDPNGVIVASYTVAPVSSGMFALSFIVDPATQIGEFNVFVRDAYAYAAYAYPPYPAHAVDLTTLGITPDNDWMIYDTLDNIPDITMTLSTYISPVRIYRNQTAQPLLLHLVNQDGDPVSGVTWSTSGLSAAPTINEISPGFYRFVIDVAGAVDVRFKATKTWYTSVTISSNELIINTIALGVFNPYVDVTAPDAIRPYGDSTPWVLDSVESVYDKLPCTIGNSFNIMVDSWDIPDSMDEDWLVYDAYWTITGVKEVVTDATFAKIYSPSSYDLGYTIKVLVTQKTKISVTIDMTAWERVDKSDTHAISSTYPCGHWDVEQMSDAQLELARLNACCHTYTKTFDICEVNSCTYGGVTLTGANITDSTTVEVGKKVDKVSVSVDPTGAPADLVCSCPNYIVLMYMTNSDGSLLEDAFTVDTWSGTPADGSMIWYNPVNATGPDLGPFPDEDLDVLKDQPIQTFLPTGLYDESKVLVDNGLKFGDCPFNLYGITFNYPTGTTCGYRLVIKVFGLERIFDACGNMDMIYPMIAEQFNPITVTPSVTTLTATYTITEGTIDPDQMLAGVPAIIDITDPGFSVDGGVAYWNAVSWAYYWNGTLLGYSSQYNVTFTPSTTDTGYRFVANCPFSDAGTFKIVGTSYYYDCTKKEVVTIEIEVVAPEFTVKIGLMDGAVIDNDNILTEGFAEVLYVTAVDPRGIHDFSTDPNWKLYAEAAWDDCDLPTSAICTEGVAGECCGAQGGLQVVGYDNPCIEDDPMVDLYFVSYDCAYIYVDSFKLVPPTVTVDPEEVPFTIPTTATHVTFTVTDAHGHGAPGVSIYIGGMSLGFGSGASGYSWTASTGMTGKNGEVDWGFVPPFSGRYNISAYVDSGCDWPCAWDGINTTAVLEAVYQAPVVDITKPVVEASAPAEVTSPMVTVAGKVSDNVGVVSLWIGAMKVDFAPDGTFSAKVEVAEGANTIKVVAFDATGNMGDKTLTVTYAVPKVTVVKVQIGSDIMTVNGNAVQIDAPAEIKNGRTFLPLRAISEALGATVEWIAETQGITVTLGENTIGLQIGNTSAVVNGTVMTLDAAPYIKNNRTMVPFRVIAEGLGATVEWDPALRIVTVTLVQ
jgi:hypothetical protein